MVLGKLFMSQFFQKTLMLVDGSFDLLLVDGIAIVFSASAAGEW